MNLHNNEAGRRVSELISLSLELIGAQTPDTLAYHIYGFCCDIGQTCIGKDVKMTYFLE